MYLVYLFLGLLVASEVAAHGKRRHTPTTSSHKSGECQLSALGEFKKVGCFVSTAFPMSSMTELKESHVHAHVHHTHRGRRDIAGDIEENDDEVIDFRNLYPEIDDFAKEYDLRKYFSIENDLKQETAHDPAAIDYLEKIDNSIYDADTNDDKKNNLDQSDLDESDLEEEDLEQNNVEVNDPHGRHKRKRSSSSRRRTSTSGNRATYEKFIQALICRCATAAQKNGYRYFGIRNYEKCMLGNKKNYQDMLTARGEHKKHRLSCRAANQKGDKTVCNDYKTDICVGGKDSVYIYMNIKDPCLINEGGCSEFCKNDNGIAKCSCSKGFQLAGDQRTCKDIDECEVNNGGCLQQCINTQGSHVCACKVGFIINIDGKSCSDINECKLNNGGCNQTCVNSPGSYRCDCLKGYRLAVDSKTCSVIDQCKENKGVCQHDCINGIGTFKCSCFIGFQLLRDGKKCIDINECKIANGGCGHKCHNSQGSHYCTCKTGYAINSDGATCRDIDECHAKNKGGCAHGCVNTEGSYNCICTPGYTLGSDGKSCKDINECSMNRGGCSQRCTNNEGSFACHCNTGFKLLPDGKSCKDINECQSSKSHECSQVCVNKQGTYECACNPGYKLAKKGKICKDIDECEISGKVLCTQDCVNTNGSYRCACKHGYVLSDDKKNCKDIDECGIKNGGCKQQCINLKGTFKCGCNKGFVITGDQKTCKDINECLIKNGGCEQHCKNLEGSFKCLCEPGYLLNDDKSTCRDVDECSINNGGCEQGCSNKRGSFACVCKSGYKLAGNGFKCIDIDECAVDKGGCWQDCLNLIGSYKCACNSGYTLNPDGYSCKDIDECIVNNGGCSTICLNKPGTFICLCESGYKLMDDKKTCKDVNECKAVNNGGCEHECRNNKGSYACICRTGFMLSGDGQTCIDINECAKNNGGCGQTCTNTDGSFKCSCKAGYKLCNCGACKDINECLTNNGGCSQECVNLEGSHRCDCKQGYRLDNDKRTCRDINECAIKRGGCGQICTNTDGSYKCSCRPGYRLCNCNSCTDIDECANNNGGCGQICINTPGSRKCICKRNFILKADKRTCQRLPPRWPQGSYGILSHDPCPPGWFEFTHCLDTQDIGNIDNIKDFKLGLGKLCAITSVTFRYCFKGERVPSRHGGFFTRSALYGEAYVVENTAANTQSACHIFGREGGSVAMDTEDINNKDTFGNKGLNRMYYNRYHPRGYFQERDSFIVLEFCRIGEAEEGIAEDMIEVGKFGTQKFGFFIHNNNRCPILRSPYGYLYGTQQRILLDLEDFLNVNHVSKPAPFQLSGKGNLATTVCQYDPKQGKAEMFEWPQGSYGILSRLPCPPGWFEFSHCIDTVDWWNGDNVGAFKLGLGNKCGGSSVSFRYCFKGSQVPSRRGGLTANTGAAYVINGVKNGCGNAGGRIYMLAEDSRNRNTFGNNGFNKQVYSNYYPFGYILKSGRSDHNDVQLSFCKIGTEVGEFGQRFGLLVGVNTPCPTLQSPYGQLRGSKQYIKLDLQRGNRIIGQTPFRLLSKGNVDTSVCQYDPQLGL